MNENQVITIVTGLPRSGTSLMMQILKKAGLEIFTDGIRQKDISNPEGYYELEAVKGIVRDNSFLKKACGKVVKIVAPLPIYLDKTLNYRFVVMNRDMEEVLKSQEKMLNKDQFSEREKFRVIYEMYLKKTYQFFESNAFPYVNIHYNLLMHEGENELQKLGEFLNLNSSIDDLLGAVNIDLYRNRVN